MHMTPSTSHVHLANWNGADDMIIAGLASWRLIGWARARHRNRAFPNSTKIMIDVSKYSDILIRERETDP